MGDLYQRTIYSNLGWLFPTLGLFVGMDSKFPVSHVLLVLVEQLCQRLFEKGSLGGKTFQTLHVGNVILPSQITHSLAIDSKLEIISL